MALPGRLAAITSAVLAAWLSLPTAAQAQGRTPLEIQIRGCGWLDHEELIRLTRLELGHLDRDMGDLSVDYACGGDDITIGISNRASGIRVERRVADACCGDVELERTVALLTVGLLRAAATVLNATAPAPVTPPPAADYVVTPLSAAGAPPAPGPALPSAPPSTPPTPLPAPVSASGQPTGQPAWNAYGARPLTPAVLPGSVGAPASATLPPTTWGGPLGTSAPDRPNQETEEPPDYLHDLRLGAALRFNNLADTLTTYSVQAGYRYWLTHDFAVGPWGEASFGATTRPGGEVAVRLFQLGVAGNWRMMQVGALSLLAEALGGATLVQIEGVATRAEVRAADVVGLTGSVGIGLVPIIAAERVSLCLPLQGGGLFRGPRGLVSDGAVVQVDGVWLSAGVAVALGLTPRRSSAAPSYAAGGWR